MTDTEIPKIPVRKTAASIYIVYGRPASVGSVGAHRGYNFLLPLTAESGDAITAFIKQCGKQDGIEYKSAHVEKIMYMGWAWLPDSESTEWVLPSLMADFDKLVDAIKPETP